MHVKGGKCGMAIALCNLYILQLVINHGNKSLCLDYIVIKGHCSK